MASSPPSVWSPASAGSPASPPPVWEAAASGSPASPVALWAPASAGTPASPVALWEPAAGGTPSSPPALWEAAAGGSPASPAALWEPAAGGSPASPPALWQAAASIGGRILILGGTPAGVNVTLMPTGTLLEGRASWSNHGTDISYEYPFVKISWDPDEDEWVLVYVPDSGGATTAQWMGVGDALDPLEITEWTLGENAGGSIVLRSMPIPPSKPVRAWGVASYASITEGNEIEMTEGGDIEVTEGAV